MDVPPDPLERRVSHYRVLHPLGAGGMGEVFAAFDETLKRRVALKAIHAGHRVSADAKARFLREAQILSRLDHPHICRVYDYIEERDRDWLVLELIDGKSLRMAIQAGLDRQAGMKIAEQVAAVLVVTHAAGVVHRDLKPGNVMITGNGDAKVLDFGLARAIPPGAHVPTADVPAVPVRADEETIGPADGDLTRSASPGAITGWSAIAAAAETDFHTRAGGISGTVAYMSPEQAKGEAATAASDMYSFGLVVQEILTGQRAYDRDLDSATLLHKVQHGETLTPSGLDPDLTILIQRLKSLAPTQRPTAVETAERLRWIVAKPARRLRRLAVAAGIALLVVGAAKYTFDLARERSAAVAAREDADRRRGQAETLIGFMLGNLRPKLQQVGRLDLLEDVGREATAYFAAVPPEAMSGEELYRRSQAIYQIGQVRQAEGKLTEATKAYRESLALAQQVAERDPANSEWQIGLATAHFYLGEALRSQADPHGAMREHSAYRDIARRVVEREPGNERWLLELSYGHANVAGAHESLGDFAGAKRELQSAQRIKEDLARRNPDDLERQQAVGNGHNRLGAVLSRLGESDAALQHFLAGLAIQQALATAHPRNYALKRGYQAALASVGRAHEDRGDLPSATRYYRTWRQEAESQAAVDARNTDWQRDLARAESVLAGALRLGGDSREPQALYARALAILRPIAEAARTQTARQRDLALAELGAGWLALSRGDAHAAGAHADAVERVLAPLLAKGTDRDAARTAADGRLLAADAAVRRGDRPGADRLRAAALALVPMSAQDTLQQDALAVMARALLALDRVADARPVVERLLAAGYRHPTLVAVWTEKQRPRTRP